MNPDDLADQYALFRDLLVECVPRRERLFVLNGNTATFPDPAVGMKTALKELQGQNQLLLIAFRRFKRADIRFRRILGDTLFSTGIIEKAIGAAHVTASEEHVRALERLKESEHTFVNLIRDITRHLTEAERLLKKQYEATRSTTNESMVEIGRLEMELRNVASAVDKVTAPIHGLVIRLVHQTAPGSALEQEAANPGRYTVDEHRSLWTFIKILCGIEAYIRLAQETISTRPDAHNGAKANDETFDSGNYGDMSDEMTFPAAVAFAQQGGRSLQSLREAVAYRIHNGLKMKLGVHFEWTRTFSLCFKRDGELYRAFDDEIDGNLLLTRAREGYDACRRTRRWNVERQAVETVIARATRNGRCVRVGEDLGHALFGDQFPAYDTILRTEGLGVWVMNDPHVLEAIRGVTEQVVNIEWVLIGKELGVGVLITAQPNANGARGVKKPLVWRS